MGTIYIARHGENKANVEKRLSYPSTPLTEKGITQAKGVAEFLADKKIRAIYTGPYKRALQTAQVFGKRLNLKPKIVDVFADMDFGILKGAVIDERWKERVTDPWHYRVPKGENFSDLYARVIPAYGKIEKKGSIVIIAHRDVNRVLVLYLGKILRKKIMDIDQPNDCIYAYDKKGLRYYCNGKAYSGYYRWKGY